MTAVLALGREMARRVAAGYGRRAVRPCVVGRGLGLLVAGVDGGCVLGDLLGADDFVLCG